MRHETKRFPSSHLIAGRAGFTRCIYLEGLKEEAQSAESSGYSHQAGFDPSTPPCGTQFPFAHTRSQRNPQSQHLSTPHPLPHPSATSLPPAVEIAAHLQKKGSQLTPPRERLQGSELFLCSGTSISDQSSTGRRPMAPHTERLDRPAPRVSPTPGFFRRRCRRPKTVGDTYIDLGIEFPSPPCGSGGDATPGATSSPPPSFLVCHSSMLESRRIVEEPGDDATLAGGGKGGP